jgi:branched-chain amino acid transport system substrate-binding protein
VAALGAFAAAGVGASWMMRGKHGSGAPEIAQSEPASSAPPDAPGPIPIGVMLDLSGERRQTGRQLLEATRTAEEVVNRSGGIRGRPIHLVVKDDQGDGDVFLQATLRELLAVPNLRVILGPMTSSQVLATAPVTQKAGVLQIVASATSPELTALQRPEERLLFRTVPSQLIQAKALAYVMHGGAVAPLPDDDRTGAKRTTAVNPPVRCAKVAIVASDDASGRPFAGALTRMIRESDLLVTEPRFVSEGGQNSYEAEIRAVAQSGADCQVLSLGPKSAARYLRQSAHDLGVATTKKRPLTFVCQSLATPDFFEYALEDPHDPTSRSVAEGVRGVQPATKLLWRPEYRELQHLLAERDAGAELASAPFVANQFDATIMAALTLEKVGPDADAAGLRVGLLTIARDGRAYGAHELPQLLDAIRRTVAVNYVGASGDVELDTNGDVRADLATWIVKNGVIVETGRIPPEVTRGP